jgi:hypothetical protein
MAGILMLLHLLSAWADPVERSITTDGVSKLGVVTTIISRDSVAVVMSINGKSHRYQRFAHNQITPALGGYSARNGQWFAKWDDGWVGLIEYRFDGTVKSVVYAETTQ